jgi:hypothetical protein
MAIYRPPKPRWPLAAVTGLLGVLVGLGAGYLLGDKPPETSDSVRAIRTTLISAAGSLDVAVVEYRESVVDGQIERQQEYDGALAAVRSSRSKFEEVRSALESLFPEGVEPIDDLYEEIAGLMEARAPAGEVEGYIEELQAILTGT